MRHFSLGILAGSLALTFLAPPSFGSNRLTQEEMQDKILTPVNTSQTAVVLSPEYSLPHDIRIHILSCLSEQKDLLRMGAVSQRWRKAAGKVWEKRWLYDLSEKPLTEADYKALARGIFPRLKLKRVEINEEGINTLVTCTHLQALELSDNGLRATESLIKLFSLSHLSHIDLSDNQIGVEGAKALAEALKGMTVLTTFNLDNNQIGNEGITALAPSLKELAALTTLGLEGNQIGYEGIISLVPSLKALTALTTLYLDINQIGNEGITALALSLKALTALTMLSLEDNQIGDEGITSLVPSLRALTSLPKLYLGINQIGNEGKKALEDLKRNRSSLTIYY